MARSLCNKACEKKDFIATIFFFFKTGFHHVGQAGLKFPTSGDLPALASQSAVITGMSHAPGPQMHLSNCPLSIST